MIGDLLVDTNIVIYSLQGITQINELLYGKKLYVSFITEIELYSWPSISEKDSKLIQRFIESCQIIEYSSQLKMEVIEVRKKYNLKMADAFISATSSQYDIPLVSADSIFSKISEINFIQVSF